MWFIDTGMAGEAFAWGHHFQNAGVDLEEAKDRMIAVTPSLTAVPKEVWLCRAQLWLVSNVSQQKLHRLPLRTGIVCNDAHVEKPNPELHRALIGVRLLLQLGWTVECDFADRTFLIRAATP
jgi:hypothetical protein